MPTHVQFVDTPDNQSMPASTVIPVLHYADVIAAVRWLCGAFGFAERLRIGTHRVQLHVGRASIVVADGLPAPPTGQSVMVRVQDVDALFSRAAQFAAEIIAPPQSYPYGERQGTLRDPGGHLWTFSQSIGDVDPTSWGGELVSD